MENSGDMQEQNSEPLTEAEQTEEETNYKVTLRVERFVPDDLVAHYADSATVIHTENEFSLSFYQTIYPPAATTEELRAAEVMKSKCIARIIMSPAQMEKVIKVLDANMDKYVASYKKLEK